MVENLLTRSPKAAVEMSRP